MEGIREYVISVTAVALIVGITTDFVPNKSAKEILRLIGGVFLAMTVFSPLSDLEWENIFTLYLHQDGEAMVNQGKEMTADALGAIIITETESYILDKAKEYDADITVEIELSSQEIPVPDAVLISGPISPYGKMQLTELIEKELGITKERQRWIS